MKLIMNQGITNKGGLKCNQWWSGQAARQALSQRAEEREEGNTAEGLGGQREGDVGSRQMESEMRGEDRGREKRGEELRGEGRRGCLEEREEEMLSKGEKGEEGGRR